MMLPVFVLVLVFTGHVDLDAQAVELGAQVQTFPTMAACQKKADAISKIPALDTDTSGHAVGCVAVVVNVDDAKSAAMAEPGPTSEDAIKLPAQVMRDAI